MSDTGKLFIEFDDAWVDVPSHEVPSQLEIIARYDNGLTSVMIAQSPGRWIFRRTTSRTRDTILWAKYVPQDD